MLDHSNIEKLVIESIKQAEQETISSNINHMGSIFSYYLPTYMGKVQSTDTSLVLDVHHEKLVMNVDVISVMHANVEDELRVMFSLKDSLFSYQSSFVDYKGFEQKYQLLVYPYDQSYFMLLQSPSVIMSAQASLGNITDMAYEMLKFTRNVRVSKQAVVSNFSNQEILNYQKTDLNMFAQLAPESGTVLDMIEGEDANLFNEEYYNDYINDSPTEEEILQD
jgi:hypothetical protein